MEEFQHFLISQLVARSLTISVSVFASLLIIPFQSLDFLVRAIASDKSTGTLAFISISASV